jgi:hypothetical protein
MIQCHTRSENQPGVATPAALVAVSFIVGDPDSLGPELQVPSRLIPGKSPPHTSRGRTVGERLKHPSVGHLDLRGFFSDRFATLGSLVVIIGILRAHCTVLLPLVAAVARLLIQRSSVHEWHMRMNRRQHDTSVKSGDTTGAPRCYARATVRDRS